MVWLVWKKKRDIMQIHAFFQLLNNAVLDQSQEEDTQVKT